MKKFIMLFAAVLLLPLATYAKCEITCSAGTHSIDCRSGETCYCRCESSGQPACSCHPGSGLTEQKTVTEKPAASASKKSATATDKMVVKEANEVDVLKVLAKPQGYVGSCGGCASNPTYCCPSNARPVCESSGACSCWNDPHCQ